MLRDFTYIDDVIEMVIRSIDKQYTDKKPYSQNQYKIYNIGNSKSVKLMDYIKAIENRVGFELEKTICLFKMETS